MSDGRAEAVLDAAWGAGIRFYDTAPHYELGLSERRLGRFLADRPRGDVVVSTKVGRLPPPAVGGPANSDTPHGVGASNTGEVIWDFTYDGIRRNLEESLVRLGLDQVDLLLLQDPDESPDPARALAEGADALMQMQGDGLVTRIGVSSGSTTALLDAANSGAFDVIMAAGRFTLLEWADDVLQACWETDTGILASEVFHSDLLSTMNPVAHASEEDRGESAGALNSARELAERCRATGTDVPTAALLFPLRNRVIQGIVLEATTPGQVMEDAARLATDLPDATWDALLGESE